jgi:hypothetical protein
MNAYVETSGQIDGRAQYIIVNDADERGVIRAEIPADVLGNPGSLVNLIFALMGASGLHADEDVAGVCRYLAQAPVTLSSAKKLIIMLGGPVDVTQRDMKGEEHSVLLADKDGVLYAAPGE